eukprot:scaffold6074_cov167-Amphora_coffeaeformis.AAC.2
MPLAPTQEDIALLRKLCGPTWDMAVLLVVAQPIKQQAKKIRKEMDGHSQSDDSSLNILAAQIEYRRHSRNKKQQSLSSERVDDSSRRNNQPGAVAVGGILSRAENDDDSFTPSEEEEEEEGDSTYRSIEVVTEADTVDEFSFDKGREFELQNLKTKLRSTTATTTDDDEDSTLSTVAKVFQAACETDPKVQVTLLDDIMMNDCRDSEDWTPLHLAALHCHPRATKFLLDCGADPNTKTLAGFFPLYIAAAMGSIEAVEVLLGANVAVDLKRVVKDPKHFFRFMQYQRTAGGTACMVASEMGHVEIVQRLLQAGGDPHLTDDSGATALYCACNKGHLPVVELLLRHKVDPNKQTRPERLTALHIAIRTGQFAVLKALVEYGADVNLKDKDGMTPLGFALRYTQREVVSLFIDHERESSAYEVSSQFDLVTLTKFLLDNGADVECCDKTGATPIFPACYKGSAAAVRLLIAHGANVNHKQFDGQTPLLVAVRNNHVRVVEVLLRAGADVSAEASIGTIYFLFPYEDDSDDFQKHRRANPLYVACAAGFSDIVDLLLDNGASVHTAKLGDGTTCLHVACLRTSLTVARKILECGADVNARIEDPRSIMNGATPLYHASSVGNARVVRLLLEFGADVDILAADGSSCLDIAEHLGRTDVARVLIEHGACRTRSNTGAAMARPDQDTAALGQGVGGRMYKNFCHRRR